MCGKFHIKLNIGKRPIANKYREGKMQRTLKRELKVLEIVGEEAIGTQYVMVVKGSGGKGGNVGFNLSHRKVAIGFNDYFLLPSYSLYFSLHQHVPGEK